MSHSIQKRLCYFDRLQQKVAANRFKFDMNKPKFGFKHLTVLQEPSQNQIKSWPCTVFNKESNVEYVVKVIPYQTRLLVEGTSHPADIEVLLLKEFNQLIKYRMSPHLTYYIVHHTVPNNKCALRRFPLKGLRHYIEPNCNVLAAEYVSGGSIEDWMDKEEPGTLEEWRYIVFAICWTLLILQDRYRCIHNDLHYGNVLLDTKFRSDEKPLSYHLVCDDSGVDIQFKVVVPGIMPKLWDWEVATTFESSFKHINPIAVDRLNFPAEFDPHYDLHYFLTTMLEKDIPDELVNLIYDLYGDEFVPSEYAKEMVDEKYFGDSSSEGSWTDSEYNSDEWEVDTSAESDSDHEDVYRSDDEYYDSSDELPQPKAPSEHMDAIKGSDELPQPKVPSEHMDAIKGSDELADAKVRDAGQENHKVDVLVEGDVKTEYLMGERLLNGAWRKKAIPTPLSLLQHDFFKCYRDDGRLKNRASAMTFRHIREKGKAWRLEGDHYV